MYKNDDYEDYMRGLDAHHALQDPPDYVPRVLFAIGWGLPDSLKPYEIVMTTTDRQKALDDYRRLVHTQKQSNLTAKMWSIRTIMEDRVPPS